MYMEAYGGATSIAEGIIKKALGSLAAKKELEKAKSFEGEPQIDSKKAVSEGGISPQSSGGVGSKADPNIVREMKNFEAQSRLKAMESLNSKLESLEGQRIYQQSLIEQKQKENEELQDKLGRMKLRK